MKPTRFFRTGAWLAALVPVLLLGAGRSFAQADPQAVAAQKEAMKSLAALDGTWRGSAWMLSPSAGKSELVQTERVGSFLDGAVKVIEGRGYAADGSLAFNALAVVSYDAATKAYNMRSCAMGRSGDFSFAPTADGFVWEIPAGGATIRYTATVKGGEWREVGERVVEGQEPVRFLEMNLKRVGDTDWPAGGAVGPK